MNKEKIAFLIVLAFLGLVYFMSGEAAKGRRSWSAKGGRPPEVQSATTSGGYFFGENDFAWDGSGGGRNFFLAPRETEDLPLSPILAPPLPPRPMPGMPVVFDLGRELRKKLRHDFSPDPKLELTTKAAPASFNESDGSEGDDPASDLDTVSRPTETLTMADKLRMSTEEKMAAERKAAAAAEIATERRKRMDRVKWPTGNIDYGKVEALVAKDDIFDVKLKLDRLYADTTISEDQRRRDLGELRFVFFQDRGPDKKPSRQVLRGTQLQAIEFAPGVPLNRFYLRRLQSKEDDYEAQWKLAKIAFEAEALEVCADHLESMHQRKLASADSYAMLSDCQRRLFRYDAELRSLQEGLAIQDLSSSVKLLARMGESCLRLGLRGKASEAFDRALIADGGYGLAHLGKGRAKFQQGDFKAAINHLRQAEGGSGLDAVQKHDTRVLLGRGYLATGDLRSALRNFRVVNEQSPEHPGGLLGFAIGTYLDSGPAAALPVLEKARAALPLNGSLAYLEGVALMRTGKYGEGRDRLELAMQLDPLITADARVAMSWLMEKVGKGEAALAEADLALQANPLNLDAHRQKARCLLNVRDLEGAKETYLRVLSGRPDDVDVLVALGDSAFRGGKAQEASRWYERAAEQDANYPDLLGRRLICDVRRGARTSAEGHVKSITAAMSADPYLQAGLAYYQYSKGSPAETISALRQIVDKGSAYPELLDYAQAIRGAVSENLNRVIWRDDFNRSGANWNRGWTKDVGSGIRVLLSEGERGLFKGKQKNRSSDPTISYQTEPGRLWHSFSAELQIKPTVGVHAGIGVLAFQRSPRLPDPYEGQQKREGSMVAWYGIQVVVNPQGVLQYRTLDKGKATDWIDLPGATYSGTGATLGVETADRRKNLYWISVDGTKLAQPIEVPNLGRWSRKLELQIFCQALIDREVEFTTDNVTIVRKKKP